jgi:hypothetical protein
MKPIATVLLLVALVFAPLAQAKVSITPEALGQVEALLNFCVSVNPKVAELVKDRAKMAIPDASEEELKKIRSSNEYKDAYAATTKELAKVSKEKGVQACQALLDQK